MKYTVYELLNGSAKIFEYYQTAKQRWEKLLDGINFNEVSVLAKKLHYEQQWFEENCGGQVLGQEIMVIAGIAQFYDKYKGFNGTKAKAQFIYDSLAKSYCSLEVKFHASDTAKEYGLIERGHHEF